MSRAMLLVGDSESNQNLYYTTHFLAGDPFVYLQTDDRQVLVVGAMEHGRAQKESSVGTVRTFEEFGFVDLVRELKDRSKAFTALLRRILQDAGVDQVVVEGTFPVLYADALRGAGVQMEIDPDLLVAERRRKSEGEIEAIVEAQRATEAAVHSAIEILRQSEEHGGILHFNGIPLTSERLRGEIEVELTKRNMGVSGSIVAGGPGAADPHWAGYGPIKAGESVILDIFPRGKSTRYYADMTRTVVKGEPGDLLRRMYDSVLQAQERALASIRAGVNGRDVHASVLKVFEETGFNRGDDGPQYIHGTGHGVGLDIHERPNIGLADVELKEGDVVSVEPGLYDPTLGGVRIEDLVVVTAGGCRNLTEFPKEFML